MAISEADIKILWGKAAGFCSRPGCGADLTRIANPDQAYNVGEMAHVIAHSKAGPRGGEEPGPDTYANLILLCPTCHRDIDKAPEGTFSVELLHSWKDQHEAKIRAYGSEDVYSTNDELKAAIGLLLAENHATWETLGPNSEVAKNRPMSNAHALWQMRRLDKILPNNRRIINSVRANSKLLTSPQRVAFARFVNHAEAYEDHVYDRRDEYPLFPVLFEKEFS